MSSRAPQILAPGAPWDAPAAYAPPRDEVPRIDERLAPPETRVEYLNGSEMWAAPADEQHAVQHADLTYVLRAHTTAGYKSAVDMLTRTAAASDHAPDASIFPQEEDPETGGRKIEELAFEVVDKQSLSVPTEKARQLIQRGVRRVFCILVRHKKMLEWSRETDGWKPLPPDAVIEDPCLVTPMPVAAVLDAAASDDAVARALLVKGVPALEQAFADRELAAKRDALREVLEARELPVSSALADAIAACEDVRTLDQWIRRAATATSAADVITEK
jgi:hypothetical protein